VREEERERGIVREREKLTVPGGHKWPEHTLAPASVGQLLKYWNLETVCVCVRGRDTWLVSRIHLV
jgi:hypothetical protein